MKAKYGKSIRILKKVLDFAIKRKIEIVSQYLRSARNISAGGLTRWREEEITDWIHRQRMEQIQVPVERLRDTDLVGHEQDASVRAAAFRGNMMGFLRDPRNKVCEWRPGCYAAASFLWDWGAPCWAYGINRPIIHSRVEFHVGHRGPRGDIFCLIGCAYPQLGIGDFKRDACFIMPMYSILITPVWVQDLARSIGNGFWTSRKLDDSASLGDICAAQWWIYGAGPTESHFDVAPFVRDIRVLHHGYANAGLPCAEDDAGPTRIAGVPNSIGRIVTTRVNPNIVRASRFPHCPMPTAEIFRGGPAHWPLVSSEERIPYICEKLVIIGGRPGLGFENSIDHETAESMMEGYYPRMVARHAPSAVLSHYEMDLRIPDLFPGAGRDGSARGPLVTGGGIFSRSVDPHLWYRPRGRNSIGRGCVHTYEI